MGEMYEWILRVWPRTKPLIYFWRGVSRSPGKVYVGGQKGSEANISPCRPLFGVLKNLPVTKGWWLVSGQWSLWPYKEHTDIDQAQNLLLNHCWARCDLIQVCMYVCNTGMYDLIQVCMYVCMYEIQVCMTCWETSGNGRRASTNQWDTFVTATNPSTRLKEDHSPTRTSPSRPGSIAVCSCNSLQLFPCDFHLYCTGRLFHLYLCLREC